MLAPFVLAFFAAVPSPPHSAWEPAVMKEAASVRDSTAAAPPSFLTHAERTEFRETGTYEECVAFYRKLAQTSKLARLLPMGRTSEGRELYILVVSKDRAFTPAAARRTGRPVVLLQNGIHAGENGGKDAAMMLLRDVLVTKRKAAWLDHVILLSIPVFNADGHERFSPYNRINENGPAEMGFRVTARRLNLNRDYLKADTPEMRGWLEMYAAWRPDLLIDNHVTDGADYQYDATIATHTEQDIAAPVGAWVKNQYIPELFKRLEALGHVPGFYIEGRAGDAMAVMTASPRYSTGYAAAQNRAALLIETHSLKSFRTRIWSHYDLMSVTLDILAAQGEALRRASIEADRAMEALQPGQSVFLAGSPDGPGEPYVQRGLKSETYTGSVAGGPIRRYTGEPLNTETRIVRTLKPRLAPPAPLGYLVPAQWPEIIGLLNLHGVHVEPLAKPVEGEFDSIRFDDVRFAAAPFEGRLQVQSFTVRRTREHQVFPAGSVFVPVAQPAGKVAMQLLEPEAADSAVRWGFFLPIFEQKEYFSDYVFEPIAGQLLAADPELKKEFDAQPATNPRARLTWLYRHSPYFEPDKDLYPVVRVDRKTW